MSVPVYATDPLYVGENEIVEADFSGFAELWTETGATVTGTLYAGSGLTLVGQSAWNQATRRAQQRVLITAAPNTVTLKFVLTTSPLGLVRIGFITVPLEPLP
jgi:hypothetical protein